MEINPCEAVKNNVIGTRMVAEAAAQFWGRAFPPYFDRQAVNPSSLMGATNAQRNWWCSLSLLSQKRGMLVRFGNVMGSNGSVIPRWLDQIAAGGR
jgi:FlaA1/EpsC-like NDP-sugar epimerase